jgi:hypothetical protein
MIMLIISAGAWATAAVIIAIFHRAAVKRARERGRAEGWLERYDEELHQKTQRELTRPRDRDGKFAARSES